MDRALRFVEAVGARYVFPTAGPPCFLDKDLFEHNDFDNSPDNIFPDQRVFLDHMSAAGLQSGRLLIPGSTAVLEASGCEVTQPIGEAELDSIFSAKRTYLEAYAARQEPVLEAERASWPRYEGDLLAALKERWEPLLALADHICEGVGAPVLLDLGEERILVDFPARKVRTFAGEECRYRFTISRPLVEALVAEGEIDWVNSLYLSLRFRAKRRGAYNEYVFAFFKCLSAERISYAEGWYAESSSEHELVRLGDWMVQRRCPHLKADLSRFGTVCDGVLECSMHGWRFDLASRRCLTAEGHDIVASPAGLPAEPGVPTG